MPATYTAYYNLTTPAPATTMSASNQSSQRNSVSSEASQEKKQSRWRRILNELKPIPEPLPTTGFYTRLEQYPSKAGVAGRPISAYHHFSLPRKA